MLTLDSVHDFLCQRMKKGQLIARIRQVARFGETFSAADIAVNGATKETVQAMLSHLKGRGELLIAQRGIRGFRPTFYFRSKTLLPVNTMNRKAFSARLNGDGSWRGIFWGYGNDHAVFIVGVGRDDYFWTRKEAVAAARKKAIAKGYLLK